MDGASLALFRVCFGLVMVSEAGWFLWPGTDRLRTCFSSANWHFPFPGFDWVRPWSEPVVHLIVVLVGIAALAVALGLFYRTAAVVLFVTFTYLSLLDAAWYLNHVYLMCLLSFLLPFLPAQRCYSLDALIRARRRPTRHTADRFIPFGALLLLRAQTAIVYCYAGIAKLDSEWLSGAPLRNWEPSARLGRMLGTDGDHGAVLLAWGGLLFDLSIVPLLLARRTRPLALLLALVFHATNLRYLPIGSFPVLAFALTLLFCEPDWPRRTIARLKRRRAVQHRLPSTTPVARTVAVGFCAWLAIQAVVPLRHLAIAGDATWTEEGYWFSWRMMLKSVQPHFLRFVVFDPRLQAGTDPARAGIDWRAWPDGFPQAVFVPVDAARLDWTAAGPLVATWEPCIGLRILDNPAAHGQGTDVSIERRQARIRAEWASRSLPVPQIRRTVTMAETLAGIERALAEGGEAHGGGGIRSHLARIRAMRRWSPDELDSTRGRMELMDLLDEIRDSGNGEISTQVLRGLEPFVLQGARETGAPFLVVEGGPFEPRADNELPAELVSMEVLLDPARLRPAAWRMLPAVLLLHRSSGYRVVWNPFSELHPEQVQRMGRSAWMIHRYARRIADRWEHATGVRPEVHVTSFVSLNFRTPRLLIDPRVDLAAASAHYFRHNSWILPENEPPPEESSTLWAWVEPK